MSQLSNVLMTFSVAEQSDKIVEVNQFFLSAGYERGLVSIEDEASPPGWYGGNKPFEAEVLVGAFNFLKIDSFITNVRSLSWEDRVGVQVFVQGQADSKFRVCDL